MGNFHIARLLQKVHIYALSHTRANAITHTYDHLHILYTYIQYLIVEYEISKSTEYKPMD